MRFDISEQLKDDLTRQHSELEKVHQEFRRTSDLETSQIVKALQSDFEFELEKIRSEHQDVLQRFKDEQTHRPAATVDTQTEEEEEEEVLRVLEHSTQTESIDQRDQSVNTEEIDRRSTSKDQQIQFNLAIQRAVQNATTGQKKQIGQLEEQLNDKRTKIVKLKECIKKLQNFYTLSSTSPPAMASSSTGILVPSVSTSLITSSTDEEPSVRAEEEGNPLTPDDSTHRTAFFKRSEPISMPSTFIVQSMLAAGNAASSPKT